MQTFLSYFLYHLSTHFDEQELSYLARNCSANQWSGKWRARLNTYDFSSPLAVDCGAADIVLKNSAILFKDTEKGVFCGRLMGAG